MPVLVVFLLISLCVSPVSATNDPFSSANALYTQSVDLANEGKYEQALLVADQALALNATAINHLVQANRAGILNMLGRYDEAISAADAALAVQGNLTVTHSVAWYNKGDALRHLGKGEEARAAFAKAQELDSTLVPPPDLTPLPTKSPSPSFMMAVCCVAAGLLICRITR